MLLETPPPGDLDVIGEELWRTMLPIWLVAEFAEKKSPREADSWLRRWRRSSRETQLAMESDAGWEMDEWLYWFSHQNEAWRLVHVSRAEPESVTLSFIASDSYLPSQAIEWLASVSGTSTVSIHEK
ncbi:hypothetical protein [Streptomyces sp. NPDC055134]